MSEFWVGIRGDLAAKQIETLKSAGIAVDDLRLISAGYDDQWETKRTCVRVSAADESEAAAMVAGSVGVESDDLTVYSGHILR